MYILAYDLENTDDLKKEMDFYFTEKENRIEIEFTDYPQIAKDFLDAILENKESVFESWIYEQEQENGESFTDYESGERFY